MEDYNTRYTAKAQKGDLGVMSWIGELKFILNVITVVKKHGPHVCICNDQYITGDRYIIYRIQNHFNANIRVMIPVLKGRKWDRSKADSQEASICL